MKKKKALALGLGLALAVLFAAAGCGTPAEKPSTPPPSGPSAELPPEETEEYPDIPDIPPDETWVEPGYVRPFDDTQKYTYSDNYRQAGLSAYTAREEEGSSRRYISAAGGIFAVNQTDPFPYGTFSATVKTVAGSDSGLVFCLTAPTDRNFWEADAGVGYYFFFVNQGGSAHLAKVGPLGRNAVWTDLALESISGFDPNGTYRLKVVLKSNKICCYVNGTLMLAYRDADFYTGTGYGLRSQGTGVEFSDISLTNDYLYEE